MLMIKFKFQIIIEHKSNHILLIPGLQAKTACIKQPV